MERRVRRPRGLVAGTRPPDVVELWDWTLGAGDRHVSEAHTSGTKELLQVQEGTITVEVAGQSFTLAAGDAVAFPGDCHSYANPGTEPARFALAVFEPGVGSGSRVGGSPMPDADLLEAFLDGAQLDAAVFALRPDYRALLLAVDGSSRARATQTSEALLQAAEAAREALSDQPVDQLPHVAAWREAYRAFGAKPQRTRNSLEALLRRAAAVGLPRVNRLTDLYNALSVLHQLPLGGEDLTRYSGPPRLGPRHRAGAVRHSGRRRCGDRAPRPWRGGVVRRRRRDLPALELAPNPPHPATRGHQHRAVHPRRARPDDRPGPARRRRGPDHPSGPARTRHRSSPAV